MPIHIRSELIPRYTPQPRYPPPPQPEAGAKALHLLRQYLDDQQWADLKTYDCFDILGSDGKRYRVFRRMSLPIMCIDDRRSKDSCRLVCIQIADWTLPDGDQLLAFLLALAGDAKQVLEIGNSFSYQWVNNPYPPRIPKPPSFWQRLVPSLRNW